ncbi:MAG: precorrin-8X methylmutase [Rhodospirillales bacterium]|nr:precorrin-8X methylmutase [Rhodospirillales bacterium]
MIDYLRTPEEIYRRSFATARAEADFDGLDPNLAEVALRLVHACAMPDIVGDLAWGGDVVARGRTALDAGATVIVDAKMVGEGVTRARLPANNKVICTLGEPTVKARAAEAGSTRSAAAVELWPPLLADAVVAIGNAPTALFRLLELLADGAPRPAAILAFPVGFVGAAESKDALIADGSDLTYLTLRGRRGGSALAAAAVNALGGESP